MYKLAYAIRLEKSATKHTINIMSTVTSSIISSISSQLVKRIEIFNLNLYIIYCKYALIDDEGHRSCYVKTNTNLKKKKLTLPAPYLK